GTAVFRTLRVRLGIEVENDRLAAELRELHGVAVLVRECEVGGCGAGFEGHGAPILTEGRVGRRASLALKLHRRDWWVISRHSPPCWRRVPIPRHIWGITRISILADRRVPSYD